METLRKAIAELQRQKKALDAEKEELVIDLKVNDTRQEEVLNEIGQITAGLQMLQGEAPIVNKPVKKKVTRRK